MMIETGIRTRRPAAPALAQSAASSLINLFSCEIDGRVPSKTQAFRCFQIGQATSCVAEARPLRRGLGVACLAAIHQSWREGSFSGGLHGILSHANVSYQTCLEKGHASSRLQQIQKHSWDCRFSSIPGCVFSQNMFTLLWFFFYRFHV